MDMVKRLGERGAKSSIPILISGESGSGKEKIARAVHGSSDAPAGRSWRSTAAPSREPGGIDPVRHEKGSFTAPMKASGQVPGSQRRHLFLDEVGELPLEMQVKLLRALQEGEIDPVGSSAR